MGQVPRMAFTPLEADRLSIVAGDRAHGLRARTWSRASSSCLAVSGCELDDLPTIHGGTAKKKPRRFLRLQGSFSAIWVSVLRRLVSLFRRPLSAGNSDSHKAQSPQILPIK